MGSVLAVAKTKRGGALKAANRQYLFIRMKPEMNTRHHRAHIHAEYQGKKATFDILTRKKTAGTFPADQTYHVQSFIADHEAELLANWESINSESGEYFRINV